MNYYSNLHGVYSPSQILSWS